MGKEEELKTESQSTRASTQGHNTGAVPRGEQGPQASTQAGEQQQEQRPAVMPAQVARPVESTQRGSPFLNILMERGLAVTVARELQQTTQQLQQETEILADKAGKYDRHLQQSKESQQRQQAADPEGFREKARIRKARQRDKEKQGGPSVNKPLQ